MSDRIEPCPNPECPGGETGWQMALPMDPERWRLACECGVCGPWGGDKPKAVARWNQLPRGVVATDLM